MLSAILRTPMIWATIIVLASVALNGTAALTLFVVGVVIGILDILIVYSEEIQASRSKRN